MERLGKSVPNCNYLKVTEKELVANLPNAATGDFSIYKMAVIVGVIIHVSPPLI